MPEIWKDYELIDCGDFEKLERFGRYVLRRPEPKALWHKSMSEEEWRGMTHTNFKPGAGFGKAGKEDSGTWERLKAMDDQWKIRYPLREISAGTEQLRQNAGTAQAQQAAEQTQARLAAAYGHELTLRLGLTSFKHVGVFPEQASNWDWIYSQTRRLAAGNQAQAQTLTPANKAQARAQAQTLTAANRPKVLNLFAYTGAASLAAKAAGADVTHLDSVRQVVTWGRQNMELSGMQDIRWVVEDAMKFVRRESRRGNTYNGIILDPPAYGHGPDGEKWKLDECLLEMLCGVAEILDKENCFMVLNLYSNGYSATLADTLVRQCFDTKNANLTCGELVLHDRFGKNLPLSVYARLTSLK